MRLKTLKTAPIAGKRVLLRTDFDVPLKNGRVVNDARILAAIPTIRHLLTHKAQQVLIISHAGRPHGTRVPALSLRPVADYLSKALRKPVFALNDCINTPIPNNKIVVLENLRFHPEEEANSKRFARTLASYADIFVNDSFAVMHRAHASMTGIPSSIPSYCGLHAEKEVHTLHTLLSTPKQPFLAIIGGGKADKMELVGRMLSTATTVFVGGVLGNILLAARGTYCGPTPADKKALANAKKTARQTNLMLPVDGICATHPDQPQTIRILPVEEVPCTHTILDIGPATLTLLFERIATSNTILFAGTPGMYENPHFATGTNLITKWMAQSSARTITAGGDTAAAVYALGLAHHMTHVSTGGGAALAFIQGKKLPGLEPLIQRRAPP